MSGADLKQAMMQRALGSSQCGPPTLIEELGRYCLTTAAAAWCHNQDKNGYVH